MNSLRMLRAAARRKTPSPLGAVVRGMIAGAIGAGAQSLFFSATARWMPNSTRLPPELQKPAASKSAAGSAVHYLVGAGWGGVYALCRESFRTSPVLFGIGVWLASDKFIMPAFGVAAWPRHHSLKEHHYAAHAHVVYGLGTSAAYALLRDVSAMPLSAVPAMLALQAWAWILRSPPARLVQRAQPWRQRFLHGTLVQKAALA